MQPDGLDVWGLGDLPVPPLIPPPLSSFFRRKGPPPRDRSQDIDMTMMLSANNYVWRRVLAQGRPENVDLLQDWERGERDGKRSKRKQSHLSRCAPTARKRKAVHTIVWPREGQVSLVLPLLGSTNYQRSNQVIANTDRPPITKKLDVLKTPPADLVRTSERKACLWWANSHRTKIDTPDVQRREVKTNRITPNTRTNQPNNRR